MGARISLSSVHSSIPHAGRCRPHSVPRPAPCRPRGRPCLEVPVIGRAGGSGRGFDGGVRFFSLFSFFSTPSTCLERTLTNTPPATTTHSLPSSHELSTFRTFTQADVAAFTALTGDSNPLHAESSAHPPSTPVVPGLLTASLFPALVGSAWPGAVYARQTLRFVGAVAVGEGVTAVVRVERVRGRGGGRGGLVSLTTTARRQGGDGGVVVEGQAVAVMPAAR
jgi:acyl dehydratase